MRSYKMKTSFARIFNLPINILIAEGVIANHSKILKVFIIIVATKLFLVDYLFCARETKAIQLIDSHIQNKVIM